MQHPAVQISNANAPKHVPGTHRHMLMSRKQHAIGLGHQIMTPRQDRHFQIHSRGGHQHSHHSRVQTHPRGHGNHCQYRDNDQPYALPAYELLTPHGLNLAGRYPDMPKSRNYRSNHGGSTAQFGTSPSGSDQSLSWSSTASRSSNGLPVTHRLVLRHVQHINAADFSPPVPQIVAEETIEISITTTGLTWTDFYQQLQCCALTKSSDRLPELQWHAASIKNIKGTVYFLLDGDRIPVRDNHDEWTLVKPWLKQTGTAILFEFETPFLVPVKQDCVSLRMQARSWMRRQMLGFRKASGTERQSEDCAMELSTLPQRLEREDVSCESRHDSIANATSDAVV